MPLHSILSEPDQLDVLRAKQKCPYRFFVISDAKSLSRTSTQQDPEGQRIEAWKSLSTRKASESLTTE